MSLAALSALCDDMPVLQMGPLAGSVWFMPRASSTRQQLLNAGSDLNFSLRLARVIYTNGDGVVRQREVPVRFFQGRVLATPIGWIGTGNTSTARPIPAGFTVLGFRDSGAAGADAEPNEVAHDHFCALDNTARAQKVNANGSLAAASFPGFGVIIGPDYGWRNPTGNVTPVAPVEIFGTSGWPVGAPR